jgi:hypothetical protein
MRARIVYTALHVTLSVLCTAAQGAEPVRIAFIGGLSGATALQGEEQLKAFYAAADWINGEGGAPGGQRFEIVPFDNKANPRNRWWCSSRRSTRTSASWPRPSPAWRTR